MRSIRVRRLSIPVRRRIAGARSNAISLRRISVLVLAAGLVAASTLSAAPAERHLAVYSTAANYSLPIVQRDGRDYVGLLELLDPLGSVSAKADQHRWRIRYNNVLGEFTDGKSRARVQGREAELSGKFIVENGRGLVPLDSLSSLLPRFLGGPATLHEESDRLFIGNIATHFTAAVGTGDPSRLFFHFTAPVNPTVATEPGRLRMTFRREPITSPASPTLTFNSKAIPSAEYSESDGTAEIRVNTSIPLIASFSPDGRTITLAPPPKAQIAAKAAPAPSQPAPSIPSPPAAVTPTTSPAQRKYFAVVDASHGGQDRGEALSSTLVEKDITLEFARRLRQELESRGITTLVLRDSDANVSLDDRAFSTNSTHAAVYIALHAASNGHGVRLYTSLIPDLLPGQEDHGIFRSWGAAQLTSLPLSQATAASLANEFKKVQVSVRTLSAPVRPMNNIETAAVAVEVAPPGADISALTAPDYQQLIAGAVANGILAIRSQLGTAP